MCDKIYTRLDMQFSASPALDCRTCIHCELKPFIFDNSSWWKPLCLTLLLANNMNLLSAKFTVSSFICSWVPSVALNMTMVFCRSRFCWHMRCSPIFWSHIHRVNWSTISFSLILSLKPHDFSSNPQNRDMLFDGSSTWLVWLNLKRSNNALVSSITLVFISSDVDWAFVILFFSLTKLHAIGNM